MQGNGFKIFAVIALILISGFYLFPTLRAWSTERNLDEMPEDERVQYEEENEMALREIREDALKLGLDLQGGMHVTLEVGVGALLAELAGDRRDDVFNAALESAREAAQESRDSFVDLFADAIEEQQPGTRLSRYFRDQEAGITARSENSDVRAFLNTENDEALDRAVEIIRQRVDRYGVSEPSIAKQGNSRISVELPGVDDPQRVRDLLRGTARLEFRLMAEPGPLQSAAAAIVQHYAAIESDSVAIDEDSTASADTTTTVSDSTAADSAEVETTDLNELFANEEGPETQSGRGFTDMFQFYADDRVPIFGTVSSIDTSKVRQYLEAPGVAAMLPANVALMLTANPDATEEGSDEERYFILGVRERVELTGDVLTDARPDFDPYTNEPSVSLSMNSEGASRWSQLTGANVGKPVAVVLDNVVYTWPNITERIPSGRTSINGVSAAEANDIVTILKSGALPAPVRIIEERTVGPSLGAKSIRAGTISVIAGMILVILFMILYYRTAGFVANIALLLNILFIFGILAAMGAVLTLPGIAGIVLTIGMAVDANVLIFERIREEANTGKTLKASIDGGYQKALSAIADANITTFFVGVILYSFGVGPIQGFAVTLMAGILSSLFTAIIVTRLIFDWLVIGRKSSVAFG